ncbi:hypothetical protein C3L33_00722, partial [Rhododendron williamsianum]
MCVQEMSSLSSSFSPHYPYVATILNCCMWVFYGLPFVHPDSILVVTINGVGLVIEILYVCVFLAFSDWPKRIPNGLGAISGAVQLILYATYYKSTRWDDGPTPASEVQLSSKDNPPNLV